MKYVKILLVLSFFFLLTACTDEKEKNDFSGASRLIAERHSARLKAAEKAPANDTRSIQQTTEKPVKPRPGSKKSELSTITLYEEEVKIIGSKSGRTLAKAVASINKEGQIVRIKILRE